MEITPSLSHLSEVHDRVHVNGRRGTVFLRVPSRFQSETWIVLVLFDDAVGQVPVVYGRFHVWNPETVLEP